MRNFTCTTVDVVYENAGYKNPDSIYQKFCILLHWIFDLAASCSSDLWARLNALCLSHLLVNRDDISYEALSHAGFFLFSIINLDRTNSYHNDVTNFAIQILQREFWAQLNT